MDDTPTLDSDDEDNCVAISSNEFEYRKVVSQSNTVFDESDDYLSAEIKATTDHRCLSGILEFNLEYTNSDISWHSIYLINDEDPHVVANYVIRNNLGLISNGIHRHARCGTS